MDELCEKLRVVEEAETEYYCIFLERFELRISTTLSEEKARRNTRFYATVFKQFNQEIQKAMDVEEEEAHEFYQLAFHQWVTNNCPYCRARNQAELTHRMNPYGCNDIDAEDKSVWPYNEQCLACQENFWGVLPGQAVRKPAPLLKWFLQFYSNYTVFEGAWRLRSELHLLGPDCVIPQQRTCYYNYFLVNLKRLDQENKDFASFKSAIFYVGKGTGNRSTQHLRESKTSARSSKLDYIRECLEDKGVLVVNFNLNCTEELSFALEVLLISFLKPQLTNAIEGKRKNGGVASFLVSYCGFHVEEEFHDLKGKLCCEFITQAFDNWKKNVGCYIEMK